MEIKESIIEELVRSITIKIIIWIYHSSFNREFRTELINNSQYKNIGTKVRARTNVVDQTRSKDSNMTIEFPRITWNKIWFKYKLLYDIALLLKLQSTNNFNYLVPLLINRTSVLVGQSHIMSKQFLKLNNKIIVISNNSSNPLDKEWVHCTNNCETNITYYLQCICCPLILFQSLSATTGPRIPHCIRSPA